MSTTITQQNIAMAQFKFALIAPVIQELYPDASKMAYYKRVTKEPLKKPDGTTFRYNAKTLEKYTIKSVLSERKKRYIHWLKS